MSTGLMIGLGIAALVALILIGLYNGLVQKMVETKNAWAQIDDGDYRAAGATAGQLSFSFLAIVVGGLEGDGPPKGGRGPPGEPSVTHPQNGTFYVDGKGNVVPTPPGGSITGSPDGRFVQARDAAGVATGVRIDGPHNPAGHPDPRAQMPHAHVPGISNPDGSTWLPIYR